MSGLELRGFGAGYDGRPVVAGLDLVVGAGEVVCLLGPNGAGKTTTLGAIAGFVERLGGEVLVDGDPLPARSSRVAAAGVSLVPEDRGLFPSLTVAEHLRLGRRRGGPGPDELLAWFPPLERLQRRAVGLLSGGEQQMVAIARALAGRPGVLLIDEMSLGLAPLVVESLLGTVRQVATDTGCAVLLVEQHVPLALEVADRAAVLSRGRLVAEGPAADLAGDEDLLARSYLGEGGAPHGV